MAWRDEWPNFRPLEHLAHYSPATLAATLRRAGLDPVAIHTPGFLWEEQTLDQMLADLGLQKAGRGMRRARLFARPGRQADTPAAMPTRFGRWVLEGVQGGYGFVRAGQVVLAIARVP
jgi:hypothetical protein